MNYNGGLDTNTEWGLFLRELIFDLFEDQKPEDITFMKYSEIRKQNKLCDNYVVFLGYWDFYRKGKMLAEPLAGDLLRASAYKRYNIPVHVYSKKEKKQITMVDQHGSHRIRNFNSLMEFLDDSYGYSVGVDD